MNETYYYGQGKVYLARRDESGHPGAWRWVGDVSALEITLSSEYKVKKISRAGKLVSVQNFMFSHSGKLLSTWHSFSPENLAILLSSVCVKNTPAIVANESLPAGIQAGDRVSLAHQNVWDVDISGLKAGVEFVVDAVWGAIEFIRTPGNQPLNASYCYANSVSIPIFTSAKNEFAFRYEGQNLAEDKRKTLVELYRVAFEPVTSFPLINNDSSIAKLETSAEVMYDINRAADSKLGQFGKVVLIEELNGITHDGSIYHNGIYTHGENKVTKTLTESPVWEDAIFQLEKSTPVLGGDNGPDNWQAQQLANRTQYLKVGLQSIPDYREYTFHTSESDPDGTIAGIAGTPSGQYFRVARGVDSDIAFFYYLNDNGNAVVVSALTGEAAIQKFRKEFYDFRASEQVLQPLTKPFAITDSDGKAALTIDENAVVEIFNLLVSAGKVRLKNGGVLADVVNTIFDSGDAAFAIADSSNAYALKIDFDGTTHIVKLQLKEPSSMTFENNKTLQDYLPEEIEVIDTAFAIVDEKDKYPLRIKNDGTVDIQKLAINEDKTVLSDGRTLADALSQGGEESKGHFDIQLVSGALYARDLNTQKRYLIKGSGVTSAEIEGEHVVFKVGSDDFYAALPDGKVFKRFPSMRLSCIGDSLTNGYINGVDTDAYPFKLGALLNIPVEKRGWSGRASGDIALRMGATVVKLTVIGNTIPASGAVVVTLVDPATGYRSGMLDNYPEGTLAGVTGTLSRSESNVWTFTRKTAGSAVPCPPGSEYLHNGYPTANDGMVITWMGRNNYESMFAEVMRDQQQFTQWITTLNKQQIVIGITNTADEPRGSANYDAILRVNSELAAAYPGRYFDAMRYLIDHGLSDAGITPTAQDLTDISKDIIPSSLRIDNTHFNAVGYQLIANQLYQLIQQLGWK